jgi:hypothetical protein
MGNNNSITISLTVPALERLFEGDPNVVVELKKGAIANFARGKIGTLLDVATKALVEEEIGRQVGTIKGYPPKVTVAPDLLAQLKGEALVQVSAHRTEIERMIRATVKEEISKIEPTIKALIEQRVTFEVKEAVKAEVAAKMRAALSAAGV